jgi:hypothetical protein
MSAVRSPQEVFAHHGEAMAAEDLDRIVSDYSEDAVFITSDGVRHGRAGVREGFERLLADLPGASYEIPTQIFADDLLLLEWKADCAHAKVDDGADTLVFRDGLIRAQTVHYTLTAKD